MQTQIPIFDLSLEYDMDQWVQYVWDNFDGEAEESIFYNLNQVEHISEHELKQWIEFLDRSMAKLSTIFTENRDAALGSDFNTCSGSYGALYRMVFDRTSKSDECKYLISNHTNFFNSFDKLSFLDGKRTESFDFQEDAIEALYYRDTDFLLRDIQKLYMERCDDSLKYTKDDMFRYLLSSRLTNQILSVDIDSIVDYLTLYRLSGFTGAQMACAIEATPNIDILKQFNSDPVNAIQHHVALIEMIKWCGENVSEEDVELLNSARDYLAKHHPEALRHYELITSLGITDIYQINTALTQDVRAATITETITF